MEESLLIMTKNQFDGNLIIRLSFFVVCEKMKTPLSFVIYEVILTIYKFLFSPISDSVLG